MGIVLNLSSRPFTNRRPFWAGILVILVVCVVSAGWIDEKKYVTDQRVTDISRELKSQQDRVQAIRKMEEERKREEEKIQITQSESYQLAQAREMIRMKTFSWDKLMSDLEAYIPEKAKLVSLKVGRPEEAEGGLVAELELGASGETAVEMTELMDKFDKSGGMFTVNDVNQGQVDESGRVPFTMKLEYHPWAGSANPEVAK